MASAGGRSASVLSRCATSPPIPAAVGTTVTNHTTTQIGSKKTTSIPGASPRSFVRGDGFIGTQTHLPPKFGFSSDFGHFILKMVKNAKFSSMSRKKKMLKYHHFWGDVPADFSTAGDASPVPPLSTLMLNSKQTFTWMLRSVYYRHVPADPSAPLADVFVCCPPVTPPFDTRHMAGETGRDREGPSPPGLTNSISWVRPGGTQYITKMGPFYYSLTVFQQFQ